MDHPDTMMALADQFARDGFVGPLKLLSAEECEKLAAYDLEEGPLADRNSAKKLWLVDELMRDIVTRPSVREVLDPLFDGEDYCLWGAQLIDRIPEQVHPWHVDGESAREGFVSIWAAIENVGDAASLSMVKASHKQPEPLQAYFPAGHPACDDRDAVELIEKARAHADDPSEIELVRTTVADGEGLFFDGRTWHGTWNKTTGKRRALLLQFARSDVPVRRPTSFYQYPFEYDREQTFVVMPIKGPANPVANLTIQGGEGGLNFPRASIAARPKLVTAQAFARHHYFDAQSAIMERVRCEGFVLQPGLAPFPAETEDDERLLLILTGTPMILVEMAKGLGLLNQYMLKPGDFLYVPEGHKHVVINPNQGSSTKSVTWLSLKWRTGKTVNPDVRPIIGRIAEYLGEGNPQKKSWERPVTGLEYLHFHPVVLQPGQTVGGRLDRHDTARLVIQRDLTVAGKTLGPGGVFYSRAGEAYDQSNAGTDPALYLEFQFHAMWN